MASPIISIQNLGKQYRLGAGRSHNTLRDRIAAGFRSLKSSRKASGGEAGDEILWALREVSFDVAQGEAIGIIGRNGAGKSTLLKILSQITEPSEGEIRIHGRIASLLEVGTGFHSELSGRENIFLNGAILGMSRAEIKSKFDEIVAFAEVGKFIDTPVKRYSSGMYMRLAFAVAAHLEPEILVVDEVLAVGDAQFQKKCIGKMGEISEKQGRTILFVSHNMNAVQSLCRRAIRLDQGRLVDDGTVAAVTANYLRASLSESTEKTWDRFEDAPGSASVRFRRACVRPEHGTAADPITIRTPFVMEFEFWNREENNYLNLCVRLFNNEGAMVFTAIPSCEPTWHGKPFPRGVFRSRCHVPGDLLNNGYHRLMVAVVKNQAEILSLHDDLLMFDVIDSADFRGGWHGEWPGAIRPQFQWNTDLIEPLS